MSSPRVLGSKRDQPLLHGVAKHLTDIGNCARCVPAPRLRICHGCCGLFSLIKQTLESLLLNCILLDLG
jgi:hypothetical protein